MGIPYREGRGSGSSPSGDKFVYLSKKKKKMMEFLNFYDDFGCFEFILLEIA